jgi:hypothetical protein
VVHPVAFPHPDATSRLARIFQNDSHTVDIDRRRALIGWAEEFQCGVDFELLDLECGCALPPNMDAVLQCDPGQPVECNCMRLSVGFAGDSAVDPDVAVDLRTGVEVGLGLAATLCDAKRRGRDFAFENGSRTPRVTDDAEWGVRAWGCPEAVMTVQIVRSNACSVGRIWSPLFPKAIEIGLGDDCQVSP